MHEPVVRRTTPAERRRAFRLLFACLVTSGVGNSIVFAVLPPLAHDLSLPEILVGVVYSVAAVLFTVMSQVWGGASDRFGRRPIILIGLVGYAASMTSFATVVLLGQAGVLGVGALAALLVLSRGLFGAFGSATGPSAQAYVADRTEPEERTSAIASLTAAFGLGAAIGPAAAGVAALFVGLVAPLYLTAILALAGVAAVRAWLPERTPPKERRAAPAPRNRLAFDPRVRVFFALAALVWLVQAAALQTIGFFVMDRFAVGGETATQLTGGAMSAGALCMLAAQVLLSRRRATTPRTAIVAGAAVSCAGFLILANAHTYPFVVAGFALAAAGAGWSRPGVGAGASLAVEPHEQGVTAGLTAATAGLGFLFAPLPGLLARDVFGPAAPYWIAVGVTAAVCVLAVLSPAVARASARARRRPVDAHPPPPHHDGH